MHRKRSDARVCSSHPETMAAAYCASCKMFLCTACEAAHGRNELCVGHRTVPAVSVSNFDLFKGMCADHSDNKLKFYCKNCNCNHLYHRFFSFLFFLWASCRFNIYCFLLFKFCVVKSAKLKVYIKVTTFFH